MGELRNCLNADWVNLDFVPFLRAWEEATVTYPPGNSAKRLRVMGICPASFAEVSEHGLDIKPWSLEEEAKYNIVSKD